MKKDISALILFVFALFVAGIAQGGDWDLSLCSRNEGPYCHDWGAPYDEGWNDEKFCKCAFQCADTLNVPVPDRCIVKEMIVNLPPCDYMSTDIKTVKLLERAQVAHAEQHTKTEWHNNTGYDINVIGFATHIGITGLALCDTKFEIYRMSDGNKLLEQGWDHYAEPTQQHSQRSYYPSGISFRVSDGDGLVMYSFNAPWEGHPAFGWYHGVDISFLYPDCN